LIDVSTAFLEQMDKNTYFTAKAVITLADGTRLDIDSSRFNLTGNTISDSSGVSTFPLGVAVCRSISLSLDNNDEFFSDYEFTNATIILYLCYQSFSPIQLGVFTVTEPATYGDSVTMTALDEMWKANKTYTTNLNFSNGQSLRQIFIDACLSCGLMVGSTEFSNNDYMVYSAPTSSTFREVLGYIAMLAGGNARISTDGYVEIIEYEFASKISAAVADKAIVDDIKADDQHSFIGAKYTLENWKSLSLDTDDISITGLAISSSTSTEIAVGQSGYVLEVENPLISGDEENGLNLIAEKILNKPFRKFSGQHIGFPIAEFMDCVVVKDRKGNEYATVLTDVDFTFCGFTEFANSAETAIRNASKQSDKVAQAIATAEALTKAESEERKAAIEAEQKAREEAIESEQVAREEAINTAVSTEQKAREEAIAEEQSARQVAIANLNNAVSTSGGLYTSSETLADGSNVWYLHNKQARENSTTIIKVSEEAIALSIDGGKNYLYGLRLNGDAITRVLSTEGINADWINAGALTIRDVQNNILFQADMESNSVTISGSCVTIGSKTVSEVGSKVDELSGYITYEGGKLTIGREGWTTQFVLSNDQIAAYLDGEVVSFWNTNEQKTPKQLTIPVGGNLRLGDFQWTPRSTGNVSLLWVGK
jgi:hypothetical protein